VLEYSEGEESLGDGAASGDESVGCGDGDSEVLEVGGEGVGGGAGGCESVAGGEIRREGAGGHDSHLDGVDVRAACGERVVVRDGHGEGVGVRDSREDSVGVEDEGVRSASASRKVAVDSTDATNGMSSSTHHHYLPIPLEERCIFLNHRLHLRVNVTRMSPLISVVTRLPRYAQFLFQRRSLSTPALHTTTRSERPRQLFTDSTASSTHITLDICRYLCWKRCTSAGRT